MEKRVGFGPRLLAAFIDAVAVAIAGLAAGFALARTMGLPFAGESGTGAAEFAAFASVVWTLAALSACLFLYGLIEALTGASPGKMMLGLKVGLESGRQGSVPVYARRWAIKYSGSILGLIGSVPGLYPVGLLAPAAGLVVFAGCFFALGDRRQALHDVAARTAVFRKMDLVPRGPAS